MGSKERIIIHRISGQIRKATPDQCRECSNAKRCADRLAPFVITGTVSLDLAQEIQGTDIAEHCEQGPVFEGSCDGRITQTDCDYVGSLLTDTYGVIRSFTSGQENTA